MFSLTPGHLSSLLSSLRTAPHDLLLVSPCGSLAPCQSSLLSLFSPFLSSLLAQHTREQGEILTISLPIPYTAILDICNITVETIPSSDILKHFNESVGAFNNINESEDVTQTIEDHPNFQDNFNNEPLRESETFVEEKVKTADINISDDISQMNSMCPDCNIYFTSNEHMELHKTSALHEAKVGVVQKSYNCTYCDETFFQTHKLKTHEKIHTRPIKPFPCTQCYKSFKQLWYLKEHQQKHTKVCF